MLFMACSSSVAESYSTGEEVYEARCSACHGKDFEGRVGPALDAASQSASMPDSYWVHPQSNPGFRQSMNMPRKIRERENGLNENGKSDQFGMKKFPA